MNTGGSRTVSARRLPRKTDGHDRAFYYADRRIDADDLAEEAMLRISRA